jgi:hypothetical protein
MSSTPEEPMRAFVPHPIEGSTVHFRGKGRCMAAIVVDVIALDPMDPDFTVDLAVFQPRQKRNDRFINNATLPGVLRWVNECSHAPLDPHGEATEMSWHYPGAGCLPAAVLEAMERG